ncbi:MAG: hypothetical protein ACE5DN_06520, partial [Flavobacteriales bacterium]
SIGRPISLDNFRDIYNVTPALAFKQLNEKLDNALRNEMVIIDKPESEELADRLLIMLRNNLHWPFLQWRFKDRSRLEYEQRACASVNNLLANDSDAFRQLEADVQTYFLKLETQQLDDRNVAGKCTPMALVLFGWLLLPFHLCGAVFRFLPFAISRYLTGRTVKSIEFYGSVLLSIGFLAYLLQLIAVFVIICCFFGILWALPAIPVILISGYVNVYAEEVWRDWLSDRRFREFKSRHSAEVEKLVSMRKGILKDAGLLSHPVEG